MSQNWYILPKGRCKNKILPGNGHCQLGSTLCTQSYLINAVNILHFFQNKQGVETVQKRAGRMAARIMDNIRQYRTWKYDNLKLILVNFILRFFSMIMFYKTQKKCSVESRLKWPPFFYILYILEHPELWWK